jgi:methylated-DNA-[protein]-cysteine S-methyltransferase
MSVAYEADEWGVGELWLDGRRVVWHALPRPATNGPAPVGGSASPPTGTLPRRSARNRHGFVPNLVGRLQGFFRGEPEDFRDVELDLDELSPYGIDLAQALRSVPRGEVVTYGELAALAGRPGAARAAGTFCARNRLSIFVPCHRVVAANGIGSYGDLGVAYKRRLLALENVTL